MPIGDIPILTINYSETSNNEGGSNDTNGSSFHTISYNSTTKILTIDGVDYELDSTVSGNSVTGNSFSQITLTSEGVLTIDGTSITLPIYQLTSPSLISFTIAGITYQAEEGMTWSEWVNSEYNTGNWVIVVPQIYNYNSDYITGQTVNDVIINNYNYTVTLNDGGGAIA